LATIATYLEFRPFMASSFKIRSHNSLKIGSLLRTYKLTEYSFRHWGHQENIELRAAIEENQKHNRSTKSIVRECSLTAEEVKNLVYESNAAD
jgi:hypothetical protein